VTFGSGAIAHGGRTVLGREVRHRLDRRWSASNALAANTKEASMPEEHDIPDGEVRLADGCPVGVLLRWSGGMLVGRAFEADEARTVRRANRRAEFKEKLTGLGRQHTTA
jgi:hypothetical protein